MKWRKLFNKKYDSKVIINVRSILKMMYRDSKVDFDKIVFSVTPDYNNKKLTIDFKHEKE